MQATKLNLLRTLGVVIFLAMLATVWAETSADGWTLNSPDGSPVSFPYEHDEPVALLFWASWCPYCKVFMPELQAVANEYEAATGQPLTVYAINFRDDGDAQAYLDKQVLDFVLLTEGDAVADSYEVYGTPGMLIFDAENNVILNLYDVMAAVDARITMPSGLSHGEKAALKAPLWADEVRRALGLKTTNPLAANPL